MKSLQALKSENAGAKALLLEGVTQNGDGTFNTVLPKSNLSVDFRLLTGRDEKFLTQGQTTKNKNKRFCGQCDNVFQKQPQKNNFRH